MALNKLLEESVPETAQESACLNCFGKLGRLRLLQFEFRKSDRFIAVQEAIVSHGGFRCF